MNLKNEDLLNQKEIKKTVRQQQETTITVQLLY